MAELVLNFVGHHAMRTQLIQSSVQLCDSYTHTYYSLQPMMRISSIPEYERSISDIYPSALRNITTTTTVKQVNIYARLHVPISRKPLISIGHPNLSQNKIVINDIVWCVTVNIVFAKRSHHLISCFVECLLADGGASDSANVR